MIIVTKGRYYGAHDYHRRIPRALAQPLRYINHAWAPVIMKANMAEAESHHLQSERHLC
jgi:hypothetical protein